MRKLSPAGEQAISELAGRHGFSRDAVTSMLDAVVSGHGTMAQFSHPEFGGSGQWMRGGMTMVSAMFDDALKRRIDALCSELSRLAADDPDVLSGGSFQSQSQNSRPGGGAGRESGHGDSQAGRVSLFVPAARNASRDEWPAELGAPASTGAQNDVRYAYFAQTRRLAVEIDGRVTVYDTLDHDIGGFSQQQSAGGTLTFRSQHGLVDLASLPVVSRAGALRQESPAAPATRRPSASRAPAGDVHDALAAIEKLGDLHAKGVLSDEEFAAKKAELLGRV